MILEVAMVESTFTMLVYKSTTIYLYHLLVKGIKNTENL